MSSSAGVVTGTTLTGTSPSGAFVLLCSAKAAVMADRSLKSWRATPAAPGTVVQYSTRRTKRSGVAAVSAGLVSGQPTTTMRPQASHSASAARANGDGGAASVGVGFCGATQ